MGHPKPSRWHRPASEGEIGWPGGMRRWEAKAESCSWRAREQGPQGSRQRRLLGSAKRVERWSSSREGAHHGRGGHHGQEVSHELVDASARGVGILLELHRASKGARGWGGRRHGHSDAQRQVPDLVKFTFRASPVQIGEAPPGKPLDCPTHPSPTQPDQPAAH